MHAVSACIYVVMPDVWCFSMNLLCHAWCMICRSMHLSCQTWCMLSQHVIMLSCRMHDVSACIYFAIPNACCLRMHLCCHVGLMHAVVACIYLLRFFFTWKNDYFSIAIFLKSSLRIYAQSHDGNFPNFTRFMREN